MSVGFGLTHTLRVMEVTRKSERHCVIIRSFIHVVWLKTLAYTIMVQRKNSSVGNASVLDMKCGLYELEY
jgi:uncharacterized protein (UPF0179 family)